MSKRETRIEAGDKKAGMTFYDLELAVGRVLVNENGETMSPTNIRVEVGLKRQIKVLIIEEEV